MSDIFYIRYPSLTAYVLYLTFVVTRTATEPVLCDVSDGLIECDDGNKCLPEVFRCDGVSDCDDGTDEPPSCRKLIAKVFLIFAAEFDSW